MTIGLNELCRASLSNHVPSSSAEVFWASWGLAFYVGQPSSYHLAFSPYPFPVSVVSHHFLRNDRHIHPACVQPQPELDQDPCPDRLVIWHPFKEIFSKHLTKVRANGFSINIYFILKEIHALNHFPWESHQCNSQCPEKQFYKNTFLESYSPFSSHLWFPEADVPSWGDTLKDLKCV